MNAPAATLFPTANPPLARLPHFITALDAELLGKIAQLTKASLALWHVPAPFDEHFSLIERGRPFRQRRGVARVVELQVLIERRGHMPQGETRLGEL